MGGKSSDGLVGGRALIDAVVVEMRKFGFVVAHRSPSGSVYMRLPPRPFLIRFSDHRWSTNAKNNNVHVVRSMELKAIPRDLIPTFAERQKGRYLDRCRERAAGLAPAPERKVRT